jgi:hypothetical protein
MSENQPDPTPTDDPIARVLRAAAAPLQRGPDARVRRAQLSALASVVRAGHAPAQRARRGVLGRIPAALRPVLAAGLALSLIAAAVVAVPRTALLELVFDREPGLEIAMAPGFEPSPVDVSRDEEYAIVTVSSRRAAEVEEELATLLASDPTVLSVRTDRTSFTVPVAVLERLSSSEGVTVVQDTPVSTLSTPSVQSPVPSWGLDRIDAVDILVSHPLAWLGAARAKAICIDHGAEFLLHHVLVFPGRVKWPNRPTFLWPCARRRGPWPCRTVLWRPRHVTSRATIPSMPLWPGPMSRGPGFSVSRSGSRISSRCPVTDRAAAPRCPSRSPRAPGRWSGGSWRRVRVLRRCSIRMNWPPAARGRIAATGAAATHGTPII